jgi:hypothetical protein
MADLTAMLQAAAGAAVGDYQISRSLRFNSADSAYLSRTPASAGDRKTWTWSGWVKRGTLGTAQWVFDAFTDANNFTAFFFNADDTFGIQYLNGATTKLLKYTTQVFRDPSAWYHIVISVDTTQITPVFNLYVNGTQVTAFGTNTNTVTQNTDLDVNNTVAHNIGRYGGSGNYLAAYSTEINFIDGQALTPTSFGETNETTGVWSPKRFSGPWNVGTGVNGFYLNFSDNSDVTAATLGADDSGNGNNWTPSGFSVTAGAGNDSLVDTPTQYGTDTGAGGEVRGNYATFNVLASPQLAGQYVVSNGNLDITPTGASSTFNSYAPATIALPSSDKYYFEYTCTNADGSQRRDVIGLAQTTASGIWLGNTGSIGYDCFEGKVNNNGSNIATYASWDNGDIVSVAVDCATGYVWFAKNGAWQAGSPSAGTGATATLSNISTYAFAIGTRAAGSAGFTVKGSVNFGQRPFAYTAPSGFKALVTTNLPEPTIVQGDDYFNTVLYEGDGSNPRGITGVGFQPDFVWLKNRSAGWGHRLSNAVVGANYALETNNANAELFQNQYGYLTSFNSDGFTVTAGSTDDYFTNNSGDNYVAWNWKAGVSNVTNEEGTITSTVRANTTSGFSIVTYTGTSTGNGDNKTVGHGLGVAPQVVIVKNRDAVENWPVQVWGQDAGTRVIYLNTTAAQEVDATRFFQLPTDTVIGLGGNSSVSGSGDNYVAYCFAEVEGFSKFSSYTGNGSADGPFIFTGFRPAFVLIKHSNDVDSWFMWDDTRNTYNVTNATLKPNSSDAEETSYSIDMLSNGFKIRTSDGRQNASGGTYIFMAFAENPVKFSLAR